jgi:methionine sulfoxide reductase heme-binding subunit
MNELLWFLDRAAGLVGLVLLSGTVVLGLLTAGRAAPGGRPGFVRAALHRSISLVAVVGIAVHVVTAIVETYVDIGWLSLLVPFTSGYDRFWIGLGTLALDLLVVLTVTSLLRDRIGARAWRLVHWSAYALWPLAMAHGLGASTSDELVVVLVAVVCLVAVGVAGAWRAGRETADARQRRRFTVAAPVRVPQKIGS